MAIAMDAAKDGVFRGPARRKRLRIAFGYEAGPEEVLAGSVVRSEASGRSTSTMNNVIHHSARPARRITWQAQRHAHSDHAFEVITHELGAALKRCLECGRTEAA